jgi:hypothetical protein
VTTLAAKKRRRGYGGVYAGIWWNLLLDRGWRLKLSFLGWCVWQETGFSRRESVFTFNLVYKEIL